MSGKCDQLIGSIIDEGFKKGKSLTYAQSGHKRAADLDQLLGFPSKAIKVIHVGGTNGKGSVATKIASALQSKGQRVGLYTSPHITSCCERIQLDGVPIDDETLYPILVKLIALETDAMFFEILTLAAFIYFRDQGVDLAVFEVGIGGRYDATNIALPILSVITSISMDHCQYLGNSINEIAANKAGIIKEGIPVVLGNTAAVKQVLDRASECNSTVHIVKSDPDYMKENQMIAKDALLQLMPDETFSDLTDVPPCRFEVHQMGDFPVVFDIAHNEEGLKHLFYRLGKVFPGKDFYSIVGISSDKDHPFFKTFLTEKCCAIYPYSNGDQRLLSRKQIEELFPNPVPELDEYVQMARKGNGVIVVCGSAMIMGDLKEMLLG